MGTDMEKFMGTLNDREYEIAQKIITKYRDDFKGKSDRYIISDLISSICWYYKGRMEDVPREEAQKLYKRKAEVYDTWRKLGFTRG